MGNDVMFQPEEGRTSEAVACSIPGLFRIRPVRTSPDFSLLRSTLLKAVPSNIGSKGKGRQTNTHAHTAGMPLFRKTLYEASYDAFVLPRVLHSKLTARDPTAIDMRGADGGLRLVEMATQRPWSK